MSWDRTGWGDVKNWVMSSVLVMRNYSIYARSGKALQPIYYSSHNMDAKREA
jgi:hypothetical protein